MTDPRSVSVLRAALEAVEVPVAHLAWSEMAGVSIRELGVSSLTLFELVAALEEIGGFVLDDRDVDVRNFGSVADVALLLERYLEGTE